MRVDPDQIDAILPQTQCGLCGYQGCKPYAEALSQKKAAINLCPPGGVSGLMSLATLLNEDPEPYISEMKQKAKPPLRAIIREAECIGCTKCIQACPVDAIVGSGKLMHTVIQDECTGCELCLEPCPVDCIEMIVQKESNDEKTKQKFRKRYLSRQDRLQRERIKDETTQLNKQKMKTKNYILEAMQRTKAKKNPRLHGDFIDKSV